MVLVLPELLAAELGGPDHQQGGAHRKHLDAMDEVVTPAEPRGVIHLVLEENASRGADFVGNVAGTCWNIHK